MAETMAAFQCRCLPGSHAESQGKLTTQTENYTPKMAQVITDAFLRPTPVFQSAAPRDPEPKRGLLSQLQTDPNGSDPLDLSFAEAEDDDLKGLTGTSSATSSRGPAQGHRPKHLFSASYFMGLVTRTISPKSEEFHSARGNKAIMDEVGDLRNEGVWDEDSVAEWARSNI